MAHDVWEGMGCTANGQDLNSEFDCVSHLGQAQANTVFQVGDRIQIHANED